MMKKVFLLITIAISCINANAQFTFSGKIKNFTGAEHIKINIPLVYNYYTSNDTIIPVHNDGSFKVVLPIKEQKFANFIFQRKFYTYLLTPNQSLIVECNVVDSVVNVVGGSSFKENKLLTDINMEEFPFFMKNSDLYKTSLKNVDDFKTQVERPWLKIQDEKLNRVELSDISAKDKSRISEEINANSTIFMNDFTRTGISNRALVEAVVLAIYDPLDIGTNNSIHGPNQYALMRSYLGYLETKAMANKKKASLKDNEPLDYYKISIDSGNRLADLYGNPYLRWLLAKNNLPASYVEKLTYQEIVNLYNEKDLRLMLPLMKEFTTAFPKSNALADINSKVLELKQTLQENESNKNIRLVTNYKNVKTIAEVIQTLKGKVVYLDIWGTWCGPCKWEIPFIPKLKANFAGKDVAYVYLDMDEDEQDSNWKSFIKINGMEGLHLRKTRAEIAAFWDELNVKKEDQAYPRYFIFDKEGKLVVGDAQRPSHGEELYKQLGIYLKK